MSTPTGAGGEQPPEPGDDAQRQPSGSDTGTQSYPDTGGAQSYPDTSQYGAQSYPDAAGYGPPAYPTGPGYGVPQQQPQNGIGIAALVFGIVGLILSLIPFVNYVGGIVCIIAIILGVLGMQRVGRGQATNQGVAVGGLVTGVIGLLIAIAWAILIGIGISIFRDNGGPELIQCVQQANGNQTRIEQCRQQFPNLVGQQPGR